MTHLQQPAGSPLCGQTCIAIIAGVTLGEAIAAATKGQQRRSSEFDLRRGLKVFGFELGSFTTWRTMRNRLADLPITEVKDRYLTKAVLCRLRKPKGVGYHWIVLDRSFVYDPVASCPFPARHYETLLDETAGYVSSWARVTRGDRC